MILTTDQIKKLIPSNKEPALWADLATELLEKYEINTANRIAGFFAQAGHESLDFTVLKENLNYSALRLRQVFPRYFPTDAMAREYAGKPDKIASVIYLDSNRTNKLGNLTAADAMLYFGRGIIQLTGKWNYTAFGKYIGKTPEEAAAYLETKRGAFESGCWYWKTNNLNRFADKDDIIGMSKAVNGGTIGLEDRKTRYARNKAVVKTISSTPTTNPTTPTPFTILTKGSKGEDVKKVQIALKLSADGVFGTMTENAIKSWQRTKGYVANGVLDEKQFLELTK